MKVLVTGAGGQLGHDVCCELGKRGITYLGTTSLQMNITDASAVQTVCETFCPDAIIHCAAWTAVDLAETKADDAFFVNQTGTQNLAIAAKNFGSKLIYVSTDYVFSGQEDGIYEISSQPDPINVYGKSKLAGEQVVQKILENYFIVRISWAFGINGNNFVKSMIRLSETRKELSVVSDQIGSPTYTKDLAPLLCDMIQTEAYGVYHATNEGYCSWYEFAKEIFAQVKREMVVYPISSEEYPTAAQRPKNSRLSKQSLISNGFSKLPNWKDALSRFIEEYQNNMEPNR